MNHYRVTYWQNGGELYMIIRCKHVGRVIPIFRSIIPKSDIITMEMLP